MTDQAPTSNDYSDMFAELEQDLLAAVKAVQAKKQVNDIASHLRAARSRVQQPSCQGDERADLLAKIEAWEQATIWQPIGLVAMVERKTCTCCSTISHNPIGFYSHQIGRKDKSLERWVAIPKADIQSSLSTAEICSTVFYESTVPFCMTCLDKAKFNFLTGSSKTLTQTTVQTLAEDLA